MKKLILILSVTISSVAFSQVVCEGSFKAKHYNMCGDGKVSITLPMGISGLNGIGKSVPMSVHIGDIGCWFTNFDGTGEISQGWTPPYNHVVVRTAASNPDFESVSLGYVVFKDGFADLVLQKNLGGFTTNYNYRLNCK